MSILSSAKVGKYSIPVTKESLLKNSFIEVKLPRKGDIIDDYAWSFNPLSGTSMGTLKDNRETYFRHTLYPVLTVCISLLQDGTESCSAKVSSIFDLFDEGEWDTSEVQNVLVEFADEYATILGDTINDDFQNKKIESIGQLMDFIKDNKPYFMKVKKLHRRILLAQGRI